MTLVPHSAFRIPHLFVPIVYTLTLTLSCYNVYDGPVEDISEQQSVWQYLSVFSIYQDKVPTECGNMTPKQLFDMIGDTMMVMIDGALYGGRFTGYVAYNADVAVGGTQAAAGSDMFDTVTNSTAYIHISEFSEVSLMNFQKWAPEFKRFNNIVIDLRGNLGGHLNVTDSIVGEFIPEGSEYIRFRRRVYDHNTRTGKTVEWENLKNKKKNPALVGKNIAVITDKRSASASEILAAALKDCAGAHLVGDTTFGKGIGQYIVPRMGRQTISVTFLQIQGVSERTGYYHKSGIAPDVLPEELAVEAELFAVETTEEECGSAVNDCQSQYDACTKRPDNCRSDYERCSREANDACTAMKKELYNLYAAVKLVDAGATDEEIARLAKAVRENGEKDARARKGRVVGGYLVLEEEIF